MKMVSPRIHINKISKSITPEIESVEYVGQKIDLQRIDKAILYMGKWSQRKK